MKNFWLITWESVGEHIDEADKIAGVLSGSYGRAYVEKLVAFLYQRAVFGVRETVYYANKSKKLRARFKMFFSNGERIFFGSSSSFLYARKVERLEVFLDEFKGTEIINWVERKLVVNNESTGYKFKEIETEKNKSISRPMCFPISVGPKPLVVRKE